MSNTYQLKHTYSRLKHSLYIQSEMPLEAFQHACAYIQLIRDKFPCLPLLDDCIGEYEAQTLLQKYYGAIPIDLSELMHLDSLFWEPNPVDAVVDLHDNWNIYVCCGDLDKINEYAIPDASFLMLEYLLDEARKCSTEFPQYDYSVDLARFESLLSGAVVLDEWKWQDSNGKYLTGFSVKKTQSPELLTSRF